MKTPPAKIRTHSGELTYTVTSSPPLRLNGTTVRVTTGRSASIGTSSIAALVSRKTKRSRWASAARMAARPSARRRRGRSSTAGGGRDGVRKVARGRGPSRAFRLLRDKGGDRARTDARRPAGGDAARGAVLSERRRRGDGVRELAAVGAYFGGRCLHARGRDAAAVRHLGRPQHARGRALLCERDPLSLVSRRAAVAASSRGDSAALP